MSTSEQTSTSAQPDEQELPAGCDLAIAAEALHITNMILAPGLGLLMLLALSAYCGNRKAPAISMNHLRQALVASFLSTIIGGVFVLFVYFTGGFASPWFWHSLVAYIVLFHLPLSWFGIVGLGRALSGKSYRYPIVGMKLLHDTDKPHFAG
jgi:hypothetical protein